MTLEIIMYLIAGVFYGVMTTTAWNLFLAMGRTASTERKWLFLLCLFWPLLLIFFASIPIYQKIFPPKDVDGPYDM